MHPKSPWQLMVTVCGSTPIDKLFSILKYANGKRSDSFHS